MKEDPKLYDLVDAKEPLAVWREIKDIVSMMAPGYGTGDIEKVYFDILSLFRGDFPGYKASNTKYHDLEHTNAVMLAVVRLMHGCFLSGMRISHERIFLGVSAALFHDAGLIQTVNDQEGSGAKYTIGHEQRSIDFMQQYFLDRNYGSQEIKDCSHLIMCSILGLSPKAIPFRNRKIETLGKIIGSADLLAQMADRYYLEKLLLLYQEFKEAGLPDVSSEFDLLKKTGGFYESVVKKRLQDEFSNVSSHMIHHFIHRWKIKKDLYAEAIENNIDYLRGVLDTSEDGTSSYRKNLRRGGITDELENN
jgi:hypothetical protein